MKNKRKRILSVTLILLFASVIAIFVSLFAIYIYAVDPEADELLFSIAKKENVTRYYTDANGKSGELSEYVPELLAEISYSDTKKAWYSLSDVSDYLKSAYVCAEDRAFYEHGGVNFRRTAMAALNSLLHLKGRFGASTITQQVIKNISGDNELSFKRKLFEIMRAVRLEREHSKDEILEVYINIVPMGERVVGAGGAAELYFGKAPSDLTLSEAATLVGISNAPTRYNPIENPGGCTEKRNAVLYAMLDCGVIDRDEYLAATSEPLLIAEREMREEKVNSWFIETVNEDVLSALRDRLGLSEQAASSLLYSGGVSVYTTENRSVQDILEKRFEDESLFPDQISDGLEFSMVIVDSKNGNLLGIVGGVGKKQGNRLLNMATVPHTPGSTLKPLALYAPLINEKRINAATVFDDVPVNFSLSGGAYCEYPKNYPNVYGGLTTVSDALKYSKNTVAVRLYEMLGAERIYSSLVSDFGFDTIVRRGKGEDGGIVTDLASSPLALGQLSYGVSLRKLTEAYTVFPSEGELSRGRSFIAVYDAEGNLLINNARESRRIFRRECANIMNCLLSAVVNGGTASGIKLKHVVDTAGKTGTSGDSRDRLFIGYTPYVTAGIWSGYRDSALSLSSPSASHLKVWDAVMREVHEVLLSSSGEEIRSFNKTGLVACRYCKDSGHCLSESCSYDPRGDRSACSYFEPGNMPLGECKTHVVCWYDGETGAIATRRCPYENLEKIALIRVEDRAFPKEITVLDAEYVCRGMKGIAEIPESSELPYFYLAIPDGEYAGRGARRRQYNCGCYLHVH